MPGAISATLVLRVALHMSWAVSTFNDARRKCWLGLETRSINMFHFPAYTIGQLENHTGRTKTKELQLVEYLVGFDLTVSLTRYFKGATTTAPTEPHLGLFLLAHIQGSESCIDATGLETAASHWSHWMDLQSPSLAAVWKAANNWATNIHHVLLRLINKMTGAKCWTQRMLAAELLCCSSWRLVFASSLGCDTTWKGRRNSHQTIIKDRY